mgnify:CR=1 FL=1
MLQKDVVSLVKQPVDPARRASDPARPASDGGWYQSYVLPERYREVWSEVVAVLKRRFGLIGLVLITTVLASYCLLQMMTETYEAKAHLLVKLGRENVEVPAGVEKGGVVSSGIRKEEINSGVLLLASRDLIAETIDEIGVDLFQPRPIVATTPMQRIKAEIKETWRSIKRTIDEAMITLNLSQRLGEREKIILGIERALKVTREGESDVITVTLRLPDPGLAVKVVETQIRHFLERHVAVRRQGGLLSLFEQQATSYAKKLEELETERLRLQAEYGLTSIDEERRLLLTRANELGRLIETTSRERDMMVRGEGPASGMLAAKPSIQPLIERFAALQIDKSRLLRDYDAQSKPVLDIGKEITSLEAMMRARFDSEVTTLQRQAATIQERLVKINEGERRLIQVEREHELAKRNYYTYSQRLEEARIASELDARRVANISVLSNPTLPIEAAYPPKSRVMLASLPAALLLGLALAFLLEYLNDSVWTARDLEKLRGVNFLGTFNRKRVAA